MSRNQSDELEPATIGDNQGPEKNVFVVPKYHIKTFKSQGKFAAFRDGKKGFLKSQSII